jgi:hypothetical protein
MTMVQTGFTTKGAKKKDTGTPGRRDAEKKMRTGQTFVPVSQRLRIPASFFLVLLVFWVVNLPGCCVDTSARARDVNATVVLFQLNVAASPKTQAASQPENDHAK